MKEKKQWNSSNEIELILNYSWAFLTAFILLEIDTNILNQ